MQNILMWCLGVINLKIANYQLSVDYRTGTSGYIYIHEMGSKVVYNLCRVFGLFDVYYCQSF